MKILILLSSLLLCCFAEGAVCKDLFKKNSAESIEESFRLSPLVRFFNEENEITIPIGEFQKERSYTVVIYNDKIAIGHNIGGYAQEQNSTSRSRSHVTLNTYINHPYPGLYYRYGGSIQFHKNGSISVSGYHMLQESLEAVANITAFINRIHSGVTIYSTPGKLKEIVE